MIPGRLIHHPNRLYFESTENWSNSFGWQGLRDSNPRPSALEAAEHGQRVFPVRVIRDPKKPGKKKVQVLVGSWIKEATTYQDKIDEWWDMYPDATPCMLTGDFFVVDLDDQDGSAAYAALSLDPEDALFAVEAPSGGQHLYFENQEKLRNTQDDIAPGIDTRGVGGFVFAPGSRTTFGEYKITRGDFLMWTTVKRTN
ncbi:MAG: bifunctional DNA primase/polymerase [Paracoccaceae bacterium]